MIPLPALQPIVRTKHDGVIARDLVKSACNHFSDGGVWLSCSLEPQPWMRGAHVLANST